VKLEYTIDITDYLQPATLASQIADLVNASPYLDGYEVVGYTIKAGKAEFDFGTTYDYFGNTGGHPALAEGAFNGRIFLTAAEVNSLRPIDLDDGPSVIVPANVIDATPGTADRAKDADNKETDADPDQEAGSAPSGGQAIADEPGDTELLGSLGADVFKWSLAEPGAHDTIRDFDPSPPAEGGDVLDLRDLLPAESAGSLDSYLHFEASGDGGTLLKVSVSGQFTGDPEHDAGVAHQTIELANVDLLSLGSDHQIIETLISQNKLITE
jgi:hypothetical protein